MSRKAFNPTYCDEIENRIYEFVEQFESARELDNRVDVQRFMPNREESGFLSIAIELLRVDLQFSWEDACPTPLVGYQKRFPDVLSDQSRLAELAFEEFRMRRIAGEQVDPFEYQRKFAVDVDNWPRVTDSTIRLRRAYSSTVFERTRDSITDEQSTRLPSPGDRFCDFKLSCELGTGAFAKVFLAEQPALANRLVALKISSSPNGEAQQLAKLQHTNIVPIHSFHNEDDLHAVCMPYFGACTLSDCIDAIRKLHHVPADGRIFDDAIRFRNEQMNLQTEQERPSADDLWKNQFADQTYVNACVLICKQIAEALRHAHSQNTVHCDLKPANVLLANHGPAMVLDFNLSSRTNDQQRERSLVGGTLPYAAPEHLQALLDGKAISHSSDIFSLGVILYQLLGRKLPFVVRPGSSELTIREIITDRQRKPARLRSLNRSVPESLEASVARMLHPAPTSRYQSMADVCEDLDRHLDDRPLRHVANRSIAERVNKWRRRHPRMSSSMSLSVVTVILSAILVLAIFVQARNARYHQLRSSIEELQSTLPKIRAYTSILDSDDTMIEGIEMATGALAPLHRFEKQFSARTAGNGQFNLLSKVETDAVRTEICECLFLMANANIHLALTGGDDAKRICFEEASKLNQRARRLALPQQLAAIESQAVEIESGRNGQLSSTAAFSSRDRKRANRNLPSKISFLNAVSLIRRYRYADALQQLEQLRADEPFDLSFWFLTANCYAQLGRLHEAEGCYTTCALMWSDSVPAFFQRGICRSKMGKHTEAERDFSRVLELDPECVAALINRSIARRALKNLDQALEDLDTAISLDASQTRIYFMRSELRRLLGNREGAREDYLNGLKSQPRDAQSFVRRGVALMREHPQEALEDFHAATKLDPRLYSAHRNLAYILGERLERTADAIAVLDSMIPWSPSPHAELVSRGVMHARIGNRDAAIADAQQALSQNRDAKTLFQVACVYAICGAQDQPTDLDFAVELIKKAVAADKKWARVAMSDNDLSSLRGRPDLEAILAEEGHR